MPPVVFLILAALLIVSALSVVLQPSPVRSALSLVVTLFVMAVMFLLLDAQLVAALQIMVYAGAIMVLFLFVIMLLNLRDDPHAMAQLKMQAAAVVLGSLFLLALIRFFIAPQRRPSALAGAGMATAVPAGFGSVQGLAERLFTHFLLAFEITSVLLLVAIVGAVVLAKRKLV
ncbi:MAG: NADH-quinone oxidoreductase subunit J [Candidatus Binatia bacterium]